MITWNTTRAKTLFDCSSSTKTGSGSYSSTTVTIDIVTDSTGGTHLGTLSGTGTNTGSNSFEFSGLTSNGESAFTQNASGQNFLAQPPVTNYGQTVLKEGKTGFSTASHSYRTIYGGTIPDAVDVGGPSVYRTVTTGLVSTQATSIPTSYTTTTTQTSASTVYTSSLAGTETVLATTATTATLTTNNTTALSTIDDTDFGSYVDTINGWVTVSSTRSTATFSGVTVTPGAFFDVGVVYKAESEWLWTYTHVPVSAEIRRLQNFDYMTNVAQSCTQATVWPKVVASVVDLVGYDPDTLSFVTEVIAADSTVLDGVFVGLGATHAYTVTTGSNLSRGTTTGFAYATSDGSFTPVTVGRGTGNSGFYISATQVALSNWGFTETYPEFYATNGNLSTIPRTKTVATVKEVTEKTEAERYQSVTADDYTGHTGYTGATTGGTSNYSDTGYYSTEHAEEGHSFTRAVEAFIAAAGRDVTNVGVCREPQIAGMQSPTAMKVTNGVGTNIAITPAIFYPFVSSVRENEMVPVTYDLTTAATYGSDNTDTTNWAYAWSKNTVSWSSQRSVTGTRTVVTSGSGTGVAAIAGDAGGTFFGFRSPVLLGGYGAVSTAPDVGYYGRGAFKASVIDTNGSVVTAKGLRTTNESSAVLASMRCEIELPILRTEVDLFINPDRVITTTRNG